MSELGVMKMPDEIIDAIQATLPDGQVIRHVGLMFATNLDANGNHVVSYENFMAVTDGMVAFRQMRLNVDLNAQQLSEKEEIEIGQKSSTSQQEKVSRFTKKLINQVKSADKALGLGIVKAFEEGVSELRTYSEHLNMLEKKYGPIGHKWLPEIVFSSDYLISDFTLNSYQEISPPRSVSGAFRRSGHQVELLGILSYSVNGSAWWLNSFFDDVRKIHDHIRNIKIGILSPVDDVSQVTKCISCGSTELTVRGGYAVCDFCQTKYTK
jgi:hypothetical protein